MLKKEVKRIEINEKSSHFIRFVDIALVEDSGENIKYVAKSNKCVQMSF